MNTTVPGLVPIIGILRGFALPQIEGIVSAARLGGLEHLEITMNSPGATEQIRTARLAAEGKMRIGAGTVTTPELLDEALQAGAEFIVTPTLNRSVVEECVRRSVPVFPGAFSPTEVVKAWSLGATMVKIFPAEFGGANYIKALRGPFPAVKLLPTGGIDLETLPRMLAAGANGAGVGSPLFRRDRIDAADWSWLRMQAERYVETWHAHAGASGKAP